MPMARYPLRGQRAICTPPPLPRRSLSLHAQVTGDTWCKVGASAGEAHERPTTSVAIVVDTPCRAAMALGAHVGGALGTVTASSRPKESGMSKKSNVHPGHYQTEGRSRPGDDLLQDLETREYAQSQQELAKACLPEGTEGEVPRSIAHTPHRWWFHNLIA